MEVAIALFVVVISSATADHGADHGARQLGCPLLDLGGHSGTGPAAALLVRPAHHGDGAGHRIIGPLICIHALGYMRDYQRSNPQIGGRRTSFFFLLFLFLAAMFGLVVSNDLPMLHVFWEITTLCSFS